MIVSMTNKCRFSILIEEIGLQLPAFNENVDYCRTAKISDEYKEHPSLLKAVDMGLLKVIE